MYVKIEPTGCGIFPEKAEKRAREGCWVGVMFRFYLDEGDPGYDEYYKQHHVYIPKDSEELKTMGFNIANKFRGEANLSQPKQSL